MKKINVGIDEDVYYDLKQKALDRRVPVRDLIMGILRTHIGTCAVDMKSAVNKDSTIESITDEG